MVISTNWEEFVVTKASKVSCQEEQMSSISLTDISGVEIVQPIQSISLNDILGAVEILQQKEAADKALLDGIGSASFDSLRTSLITWASLGLPPAFTLMEVAIVPPSQCSDGVTRDLTSYITFCSGKTIHEHVALLQAKLTEMTVSFTNFGHAIGIVVSRS